MKLLLPSISIVMFLRVLCYLLLFFLIFIKDLYCLFNYSYAYDFDVPFSLILNPHLLFREFFICFLSS